MMTRFNSETRSTSETNKSSPAGRTYLGTTTVKRRLKWIGLVSLIPIVFLIAIVSFIGYRETIASGELKAKLEELRQAGEPFDDKSMTKYFENNTHKEGTAAWTEILTLSLAANAITHKLPVVGDGSIPFDLGPGSEWPDESRVAEFLQEVRPLIHKIYNADEFPKPVWMPIHFNGFSTLLPEIQESRSTARVLYLDAFHALYHKEGERALQDIHALRCVAQAFDWDTFIVAKMVSFAIHGMQRDTINRSLSMDIWSHDQLTSLSNQVNHPYEASKAWRATLAGERGMAYPVLSDMRKLRGTELSGIDALMGLPVMPSTKLTVLRAYDDLQHCADAGDVGLVTQAEAAEARFYMNQPLSQAGIFWRLLIPGVSSYAEMLDRFETNRRLTYASVAVKLYQVRNKRWPKSLSELADVGLVANDWTTTNRQPFGYEVKEDMAYVWAYSNSDKKTVPKERPKLDPADTDGYMEHLVSIR